MATERDLSAIRAAVRPVVFGTGIAAFPVSTAGTAFLLSDRGQTFAITAKHVVGKHRGDRVLIYPSNSSHQPLGIQDFYRVNADAPGEEAEDFLVFKLDRKHSKASAIRFTDPVDGWQDFASTSKYFLLGYPEPSTYVDYQRSVIHSGQVLLAGNYSCKSVVPHCHEIVVENPHSLSTFSGFSGGPVFCLRQRIGMSPELNLCGIALQGTPTSGIVRFLDSALLRSAIEQAHLPKAFRHATNNNNPFN